MPGIDQQARALGGVARLVRDICLIALPVMGIVWVADIPLMLGMAVQTPVYLAAVLGLSTASGFLAKPYRGEAGLIELVCGLLGLACWLWAGYNFDDWILDTFSRGPEKWVPAAIGIALTTEAMRRNCGLAITALVWVFLAYAFLGHHLPGAFEAIYSPPKKVLVYLYSDTNAILGLVLRVGASIVLAFILMGRMMEVSGASAFFTDTALATMGHRRGGPAKVAIVASSAFGTINGTTVGNIMSTGIVTIPLMKRAGFAPSYAGAIEAVASNGGQLAPPIMGTTAFLIADFLQIDYAEVAIAAILPAVIYYLALFVMVDRYAVRHGLHGMARKDLPKLGVTFARGWIFVLPIALLLYLLFWLGYNPGKSALWATAVLLPLAIFGMIRRGQRPGLKFAYDILAGTGQNLVPLMLVCGGAGIVIGVLNLSGLGQSLVTVLGAIAEQAGLLVMLAVTALIAIILGMGMPTATVYILLSVVLSPALQKMGVPPLAGHLFIFYFGMLSMLTPPVAIASFVAAGMAGSNMWSTGLVGLKLAAVAYLLPFLMVFNPALIMQGSTVAIVLVTITVVISGWLLAYGIDALSERDVATRLTGLGLLVFAVVLGASTIWLGDENWLVLAPAAIALGLLYYLNRRLVRAAPKTAAPVESATTAGENA